MNCHSIVSIVICLLISPSYLTSYSTLNNNSKLSKDWKISSAFPNVINIANYATLSEIVVRLNEIGQIVVDSNRTICRPLSQYHQLENETRSIVREMFVSYRHTIRLHQEANRQNLKLGTNYWKSLAWIEISDDYFDIMQKFGKLYHRLALRCGRQPLRLAYELDECVDTNISDVNSTIPFRARFMQLLRYNDFIRPNQQNQLTDAILFPVKFHFIAVLIFITFSFSMVGCLYCCHQTLSYPDTFDMLK